MTPSKIFLYFCLSFIGGIFLGSFFKVSQLMMLSFLVSGLVLISVLWKHKKIAVAGFCLLFLVLGIWRHNIAELRIKNNELGKYNDSNRSITLIGIVSTEPDIREKSQKLTIKLSQILADHNPPTPLPQAGPSNSSPPFFGKILVTANRYPEYQYGDKLKITGKLETPPIFEGGKEDKSSSSPFAITREFNYKDYLKKDGI